MPLNDHTLRFVGFFPPNSEVTALKSKLHEQFEAVLPQKFRLDGKLIPQKWKNYVIAYVIDLPPTASASDALSKLHWKPLDRRRTEHRAIFMFKVVNNLFMHTFHCSFNSNYHNYNTRSKRNIRKSSAHRRWGHWITSNFAADAWNALPLSLRDVPTLSQFKRGIKKALF